MTVQALMTIMASLLLLDAVGAQEGERARPSVGRCGVVAGPGGARAVEAVAGVGIPLQLIARTSGLDDLIEHGRRFLADRGVVLAGKNQYGRAVGLPAGAEDVEVLVGARAIERAIVRNCSPHPLGGGEQGRKESAIGETDGADCALLCLRQGIELTDDLDEVLKDRP